MKIAILLLAHKNKEQLERLLSVLHHENIDIFIHLDKKASFSPEDIVAPHVYFTKKRFDVGLFEFSMVEAEMELIYTARSHGSYRYFILMSGQCYPLQRIDYIYSYLKEQYPKPLIEIVAPTDTNYVRKNFAHVYILKRFKLKTYAFLKANFSYKGYRILRYLPGGFVFAVSLLKELFVKSPKHHLDRLGISTYCGSQWWILPDSAIESAVSLYENKAFCKIICDVFSCDETFFQTAIMMEKERHGITLDSLGNYMYGQWFFIFDGGHPIILTDEHSSQLADSKMLFARKFDITVNQHILDRLDENNTL